MVFGPFEECGMSRTISGFSHGNQASGKRTIFGESPNLSTNMSSSGFKREFSRTPIASRVFEMETLDHVGVGAERG